MDENHTRTNVKWKKITLKKFRYFAYCKFVIMKCNAPWKNRQGNWLIWIEKTMILSRYTCCQFKGFKGYFLLLNTWRSAIWPLINWKRVCSNFIIDIKTFWYFLASFHETGIKTSSPATYSIGSRRTCTQSWLFTKTLHWFIFYGFEPIITEPNNHYKMSNDCLERERDTA